MPRLGRTCPHHLAGAAGITLTQYTIATTGTSGDAGEQTAAGWDACLLITEDAGERRYELGATGHGPAGAQLAERLCAQIRVWDANRAAQPTITAYPAGTPDDKLLNGLVIDKQHTRLVLTA